MYCETCGERLEIKEIQDGNVVYACQTGHWWILDRQTGLRPYQLPGDAPDPSATGDV